MRLHLSVLFVTSALLLASCGGGGGSSPSTTPITPTQPQQTPTTTFAKTTYAGTRDVEFSDTLSLVDRFPNVHFPLVTRITTGSLPPGLSLAPSASLPPDFAMTGKPTTAGTFAATIEVRDSSTVSILVTLQQVTFTIDSAFVFAKARIGAGVVNAPYSETLTLANGTPPYTFSATGVIPTGVQLDPVTGKLSGTPTQLDLSFDFQASATDSSSPAKTTSRHYDAQVFDPIDMLAIDQQYTRGFAIQSGFSILGGLRPYRGRVVGGTLPPGISLQDQTVSFAAVGTPTVGGQFIATIEARDSYSPPNTVQRTFNFFVRERPASGVTRELPHAVVGVPYQFQLASQGGLRPYTYTASTGTFYTMPPGLAMSSTGLITGTPTTAGTYSIATVFSDSSVPPYTGGTLVDLLIVPAPQGRNDALATATPLPIQNAGPFSLSPYATATGVAQPDHDYFKLTVDGGKVLSVVVVGQFGTHPAGLDPAIELLAPGGARLTTCRNPGTTDGLTPGTVDPTPLAFDDPCVNDDFDPGVNTNSKLELQVQGVGPQTVYLHVFDLNGRARPDMKYDIQLSAQ